jgi:hypothetical protein
VVAVVIGGILLLRVDVVCTSEFDEDNPSVEELILDERFGTVQNDEDCVWELLTVGLLDNEVEL